MMIAAENQHILRSTQGSSQVTHGKVPTYICVMIYDYALCLLLDYMCVINSFRHGHIIISLFFSPYKRKLRDKRL